MPPHPCSCGRARPAAVVNDDIRRLVDDARTGARPMDQDRYAELLEEWAAARQRELVAAA